ncbi:hypothetical protein AB6806_23935 [Bosea sp. RCC_152_1]
MTYHVYRQNGRWRVETGGHQLPGKFSRREAIQVARLLAGWRGTVRIQSK